METVYGGGSATGRSERAPEFAGEIWQGMGIIQRLAKDLNCNNMIWGSYAADQKQERRSCV